MENSSIASSQGFRGVSPTNRQSKASWGFLLETWPERGQEGRRRQRGSVPQEKAAMLDNGTGKKEKSCFRDYLQFHCG